MLETRFPRLPGDIGNPLTFPFPVIYQVVTGASAERVVNRRASGLLDRFIAAAEELVRLGADGITTTCGFLSIYQRELARAVDVPVATSALMQIPLIQSLLPATQRVGIITVSKRSLTPEHLSAIGIDPGLPIAGTENGREFHRVIIGDEPRMDAAKAEQDILDAGRELLTKHSDIGAVLLECTNMPPYAARLREELGLPVFDMVSFLTWFYAGLSPRGFR